MGEELVGRLRDAVVDEPGYGLGLRLSLVAEDVRDAADLIERQSALIRDMAVVIVNRCDQNDPKVKDVLIRAVNEQPEGAALSLTAKEAGQ